MCEFLTFLHGFEHILCANFSGSTSCQCYFVSLFHLWGREDRPHRCLWWNMTWSGPRAEDVVEEPWIKLESWVWAVKWASCCLGHLAAAAPVLPGSQSKSRRPSAKLCGPAHAASMDRAETTPVEVDLPAGWGAGTEDRIWFWSSSDVTSVIVWGICKWLKSHYTALSHSIEGGC